MVVLLGLTLSTPGAAADELWSQDKAAHVAGSYCLALTTTLVLRRFDVPRWLSVVIASATTLAVGTIKELAFDDRYSWLDQAANTTGVAASAGLVFTLEL